MSDQHNNVMIEAEMLTKHYGPTMAIEDISFTCKQGEIVGFLGPNGAGKTTTMRILTGYMPPTSGEAYIAGYNTISESIEARQHLGYLPETVPLYPEMSVEGYLSFMGQIRRIDDLWDRIDEVLEDVDLLDRAESYIGSLSKGMRQRLGLAQALLHDPDVLILDEPTIGLDPAQIVEIRKIIADIGRKRTILLSTHILSEVEQICNRVILVIDGRIYADMSMADIKSGINSLAIRLANPVENTASQLSQITGVQDVSETGVGAFTLTVDDTDKTAIEVTETAVKQQWGLLAMVPTSQSLESIFLKMQREAEHAAYVAAGGIDEETADQDEIDLDETETVVAVADHEEEEA